MIYRSSSTSATRRRRSPSRRRSTSAGCATHYPPTHSLPTQYPLPTYPTHSPTQSPPNHPPQGLVGRCFPAYRAHVVSSSDASPELDSDGEELRFEALVEQLFELLLVLAGSNRYNGLIKQSIGELAGVAVGYMQARGAALHARFPGPSFVEPGVFSAALCVGGGL